MSTDTNTSVDQTGKTGGDAQGLTAGGALATGGAGGGLGLAGAGGFVAGAAGVGIGGGGEATSTVTGAEGGDATDNTSIGAINIS